MGGHWHNKTPPSDVLGGVHGMEEPASKLGVAYLAGRSDCPATSVGVDSAVFTKTGSISSNVPDPRIGLGECRRQQKRTYVSNQVLLDRFHARSGTKK